MNKQNTTVVESNKKMLTRSTWKSQGNECAYGAKIDRLDACIVFSLSQLSTIVFLMDGQNNALCSRKI